MFTYWVAVGFTTQRPIIPEQHTSLVTVLAGSDQDALLTSLLMVAGRPGVVMPTSANILEMEI